MTKRKQPTNPRPPKRAAALPLGRPIDRLKQADKERIKADVAAFLAYVRRRKAEAAGLLAADLLAAYNMVAWAVRGWAGGGDARPIPQ